MSTDTRAPEVAPSRPASKGRRLNRGEILVAIAFTLVGLAVAGIATGYQLGDLRRMGPGYFPLILGLMLAAIGVALVIEVIRSDNPPPPLLMRPFMMLSLGIISFAQLVERAGMVPAVFSLVVLSALGERTLRPLAILAIAVVMSAVSVMLFIQALGIPVSAFPE
ncbi:tripartite tricarboxylate transporter TctB family protein [Alloalcanivorax sp. C16-2]|uniref:tripartite tricarboxylate transporter TctB family protein n=1 Tax=Alloalcanivorax sp. C16-2 TaxID=3390052 RepID=UPI003970BF94